MITGNQKIIYLYPEGGSWTLSGIFSEDELEDCHRVMLEDGAYRVVQEKQEEDTITYTLEKL